MTPRPWLGRWAVGWVEWLGGNPPKQARVDQEAADSPGNAISRRSLALLDHHHFHCHFGLHELTVKGTPCFDQFWQKFGIGSDPPPAPSWSKNINFG